MKKVGLVVMAEDSLLNGSGFAPRYQILDGLRKASYNIEKKRNKVFKKDHLFNSANKVCQEIFRLLLFLNNI